MKICVFGKDLANSKIFLAKIQKPHFSFLPVSTLILTPSPPFFWGGWKTDNDLPKGYLAPRNVYTWPLFATPCRKYQLLHFVLELFILVQMPKWVSEPSRWGNNVGHWALKLGQKRVSLSPQAGAITRVTEPSSWGNNAGHWRPFYATTNLL